VNILSSLDELIFSAKKLISEGNYLQAVREYGSVLEIVLRRLYREYFPQLPFTDKEKAISFEKRQGKSADGFTIGEWIGLFREARLLDFIAERKNIKKPLFFTFSLLDILNKLRNKATHPDEVDELKKYDMKVIASFMASGVECLLHELGIKVLTPTAEVPVSLVPSRGMFSKVKREDILNAAKDPRIESFRWVSKYVEIEGKKYSVKGLLSIASGIPPSKFTTNEAERVLERLGFKVISANEEEG
jgi:hypothetical protein